MNKTRIVLIVAFLLVFSAGVSLGLLLGRPKSTTHNLSVLAAELNLNPQQRDQMEKIWSDVMGTTFRQHGERRAALQRERDEGILSLIPDEQRSKFDLVQQYYSFRMETLAKEREKAFEQAVEQTKKILTPDQAKKYDDLMKQQRERWRSGGYRGTHRHAASSTSKPTTNPQSAPQSGE